MVRRKQTIVDKKFQLRNTFSIIGITFIILLIIIAVIGINTAQSNHSLKIVIENQRNIVSTQEDILNELLVIDKKKKLSSLKIETDIVSKDIIKNKDMMNENISTINSIAQKNNLLLNAIIIFVVLLGIVFYLYLLEKLIGFRVQFISLHNIQKR